MHLSWQTMYVKYIFVDYKTMWVLNTNTVTFKPHHTMVSAAKRMGLSSHPIAQNTQSD